MGLNGAQAPSGAAWVLMGWMVAAMLFHEGVQVGLPQARHDGGGRGRPAHGGGSRMDSRCIATGDARGAEQRERAGVDMSPHCAQRRQKGRQWCPLPVAAE